MSLTSLASFLCFHSFNVLMCKCQGPHSWIEDVIESQVICYKESFSHCKIEVGEKWYLFFSLFKSLLCLLMHDNHMICLLLCLIFHSRVYILSWNMIGVRNLLFHWFIIMTTRLFCPCLLKKHMHFNNVINIINLSWHL